MKKTEHILQVMEERKKATGVPMTLFAACPNSLSVIKASFRAAKRNNAPIYFATTLNQVDCDGGYTGMTQEEFTKILAREAAAVHYTGPYVVAIDHGGPWLKDKQSIERWDTERAMDGVKKSYEAAILAGYDLIHVDPTVDIFLPKGEIIDIHVVVKRTVELIKHAEDFRKAHNIAPISYEVGTEEVHGGLAIGLFEPVLRMISMPVEWKRYDNKVTMALHYELPEPVLLEQGDTLRCFQAFRLRHEGDYFNALRIFSDYMQAHLGVQMQPSEPEAFEPVWCAWGYGRPFKMDMVLGTLDKVAELGFTWVDIDDGYQIAEGDWNTNALFPGGDKDMRHITDEVHKRGMKAKLWWAPLAADPDTKLVKEHPEMLLRTEEWAPEFITWWDSWYLSPVSAATDAYTADLLKMFLDTWNFDGLKIDGQHLNCCMPDYGETAELESPYEAPERMYTYYEKIYNTSRQYKPNAVIQICPCGCAVNYWIIPQINQAVASDPMSSRQVRMKRKAYAAMAPALAYYGDHVELTDNGNDFASQIGTGSVIGTKFTWPKDNPDWKEGPFLLTPEKEALIRKWMQIYKENNLARGEYVNLYTWGFDYPEAHVIRQNDAIYYAFYVDDTAFEGTLELRGLDTDKTYTALEYTADEPHTFEVDGANPNIEVAFERSYLIKLTPNN